jgi:hypothetical protein
MIMLGEYPTQVLFKVHAEPTPRKSRAKGAEDLKPGEFRKVSKTTKRRKSKPKAKKVIII